VKASELPDRQPCWLLIGNSRWHWAEAVPGLEGDQFLLKVRHLPPPLAPVTPPVAWAAVGPPVTAAALPASSRIHLGEVPLAGAPPWLGIDRALAGWRASQLSGGPVLVADAGTVLSFTLVDGEGRFSGGRLMAGAALQLRAMAAGTDLLPEPMGSITATPSASGDSRWPLGTAAAMRTGVCEGLAAAVREAARQARADDGRCRIVLTGGDGEALLPLLREAPELDDGVLLHRPDLCLEALVSLRPPAGESTGEHQLRPRSSRI
jgi:type III pantothenate kinase